MEKPAKCRRDILKLLSVLGVSATQSAAVLAEAAPGTVDAGGKIVFENEKVRVIEHLSRPRLGVCGAGMHSHPPHLTICLTDVKARVTLPGKEPFIAENKSGDVFWDPGGPHVVEYIGARESRSYLLELKGAT
jgi:beta-alanine degradation protein BauB